MKLSGHEKSLVDAGQPGRAMAALVDRTGCGLREAFEMVVAYGDAQKPRRRLERVYWVVRWGNLYLNPLGYWVSGRQHADECHGRSEAFSCRERRATRGRRGRVFRVSVFRVKP